LSISRERRYFNIELSHYQSKLKASIRHIFSTCHHRLPLFLLFDKPASKICGRLIQPMIESGMFQTLTRALYQLLTNWGIIEKCAVAICRF
jgi:hypothetical protein